MGKTKPPTTLKAFLKRSKKTQERLAEALGITQPALSMIVSGDRIPRGDLALKIHKLTGVPLAALFKRRKRAA